MPGETVAGRAPPPSSRLPAGVGERIAQLRERYGLALETELALARLLEALAAEPSPPTKIRDPAEAVDLHLADSLAGLEIEGLLRVKTVADIGSGAGFPGLPLAAALPDTRVDLVEAARRRCEVIDRLSAAAGLANARPLPLRAEEWASGAGWESYGAVTARAIASLPVLVEYGAPLLERDGVLVAWKGARDAREERAGDAAAARVGLSPGATVPVAPFEGARNRHLRVYAKIGGTPQGLPRRPGRAAKRPLV